MSDKTQLDRIEQKLDAIIEAFAGPAPKGNPKKRLPELIRLGFQRQQAAFARAQKRVGKGRGAVRSTSIKRRLEKEAKK
jgi:hypothetical protein